jgi:hypothetical protein
VGLANLGSELETCVGSRVRLVGVPISFEKNFYRLPFTLPSLVRRIDPSPSSSDLAVRDVVRVVPSVVWRASQQRGVAWVAVWGR